MSTAGSSRPVPRPLQLPSNASSPRSSPVIGKSPLSASVRYNSDYERSGTPVTSPRIGPKRHGSIPYTSSPSTSSPSNHVRRNTVDIVTTESPTVHQRGSLRPRSLLQPVNETEPATLAEKHADLLRFIAQKESKCMELRTQLAQHEAELLVLKQKWERIVSKGSPVLPRSVSVDLRPATSTRSGDVLGGIREGVQNGFEKVLAVLEPAIVGSSSSDSSSSSSAGSPVSTTTSTPLPSKPPSMLKHSKNTDSISFSQGRSSMSSSVSSLFDETLSNGTRSLDSPIGEDERPAHKSGTPSSINPLTNANDRMSPMNKSMAPPSTLSQLSSSFTSPDGIVPLGKSVAQWVSPTLNKKWEELKKNETVNRVFSPLNSISRQSKRASLLFNDMLSSLSTSTSSTPASTSPPVRTSNSRSPISPLALESIVGVPIGTGPPLASLLDDISENQLGVVLQPDNLVVPTTKTVPNSATNDMRENDDDDDDDKWNW